MSLIADALQPSLVPGILNITGRPVDGLDGKLLGSSGFYPSYDFVNERWELDFQDPSGLVSAITGDCSRLACASFQTFTGVPADVTSAKLVPWALVRGYYGAFYGGHALLRLFGRGCIFLDAQRLKVLSELLTTYGVTPLPKRGLYRFYVTNAGRVLQLVAVPGAGAHEGFWNMFVTELKGIADRILQGGLLTQRDSQTVWDQLQRFLSFISSGGANATWLSAMRNSVQYRQQENVWFPSKLARAEQQALKAIASKWLCNPDKLGAYQPGTDLQRFLFSCMFTVSLCRDVLCWIDNRCGRGRSFVHFGPLRYLNSANVGGS
jgi:hypothetical protein